MKIPIHQIALFGLLTAVPLSSWLVAYRPMNDAAQMTADSIRTRTNQLTNFVDINTQYRDLRAISKSLKLVTNETIANIPEEANTEQWLQSASDAAKLLGLVVRSVTTSGEREEGDFKVIPVDLNLSGSYSNVYQWIQHLERMDRVVRVDRMTIHKLTEESVEARMVIHLVFGTGDEA